MGQRENDQNTSGIINTGFSPDRREFVKLAVGGALGAAGACIATNRVRDRASQCAPGIKLCAQAPAKPTDDDLLFLKPDGR